MIGGCTEGPCNAPPPLLSLTLREHERERERALFMLDSESLKKHFHFGEGGSGGSDPLDSIATSGILDLCFTLRSAPHVWSN